MRGTIWVYSIWCRLGRQVYVKIGYTTNFYGRLNSLLPGMPENFIAISKFKCWRKVEAVHFEQVAHLWFKEFATRGEWFRSELEDYSDLKGRWNLVLFFARKYYQGRMLCVNHGENVVYEEAPEQQARLETAENYEAAHDD